MRFGGIALMGLMCGCFGPSFPDGQIQCTSGLCPEGYRCEDGFCVNGAGDPISDIDATVAPPTPDAGADATEVGADAMPIPTPCYGLPAVPVTIGQIYTDDSSDDNFDNANGCQGGPSAGGDEHYYSLEIDNNQVPISVTVDVQGNFDIVLRLRQGICDDEAVEFVCQDTRGDETVTRTLDVAATYYIIVDSHNGDNGGGYDLLVTEN